MRGDVDLAGRSRPGARSGGEAAGRWLLPRLAAGAVAMLALGVALLVGLVHAGLAALLARLRPDGRGP